MTWIGREGEGEERGGEEGDEVEHAQLIGHGGGGGFRAEGKGDGGDMEGKREESARGEATAGQVAGVAYPREDLDQQVRREVF